MNSIIAISMTLLIIYSGNIFMKRRLFNHSLMRITIPFIGLIFMLLTLNACNFDLASESTENVEENDQSTKEIAELEDENTKLQNDNEICNERKQDLIKTNGQIKDEKEELQEENEELTDENKELAEKVEKLEMELEEVKTENESSIFDNENLQDELSKLEENQKSTTTTQDGSNYDSSTKSDTGDEPTGDCDIKGSQNGIYHVPGSTYYSRTKNVAEWFCSKQEAENAGYHAPKR